MAENKVLIVDDEPGTRFGIRDFLESHQYQVKEAGDCREAEARCRGADAFLSKPSPLR